MRHAAVMERYHTSPQQRLYCRLVDSTLIWACVIATLLVLVSARGPVLVSSEPNSFKHLQFLRFPSNSHCPNELPQFRRVVFTANITLHCSPRCVTSTSVPRHCASCAQFFGCGESVQWLWRQSPAQVSKRIQGHTSSTRFRSTPMLQRTINSACALFLALIFCLRMMCFQHAIADRYDTPALEEFRVSLSLCPVCVRVRCIRFKDDRALVTDLDLKNVHNMSLLLCSEFAAQRYRGLLPTTFLDACLTECSGLLTDNGAIV